MISGNKDIDRDILNKLDDKELLKACSIDKYTWNTVCDDEFFHRRILVKYSEIKKFRRENETWKHFFLRTITYISLMREKFNVSTNHLTLFENYQNNINRISYQTALLGELNYVKWSLKNGADINFVLRIASEYGHLEIVKYLVENGADIHADDDSALRWASNYGRLEIVKYLVEKGADIHAKNDFALIWANMNGHLEVVKYLVEHGAGIDALASALKYASENGHLEIVKYLRNHINK